MAENQANQSNQAKQARANELLDSIDDKLPAGGVAADHTTAIDPSSARLSDGAVFYKATTPADTQPVSVAAPVTVAQATAANLKVDLSDTAANATALKTDGSAVTQPVSGTFWQATQPISAAALPLPASASQEHTTAASPHAARLTDGAAFYKATTPADTQPVSADSLPLPAGAALDATLTGGTQKSKIVDSGGTNAATVSAAGAVKTDGSAVTQPVSGTFWQATQPVSGTVDTELPAAAALADAVANPTVPTVGAGGLVFNGTTWDRWRGNHNGTTGDSGTKTASFNGATQTNYNSSAAIVTLLCGTVSGTTPTLNMRLQYSFDGGTTWLSLGPATSNATATGHTIILAVGPNNWSQAAGGTPANMTHGATQATWLNAWLPRTWRILYTIAGTTPSFAITGVYVNYVQG